MPHTPTLTGPDPAALPHLARIAALGLAIITYRHASVVVRRGEHGETGREALPRDIIGPHATLISFRAAERPYDIDGYEAHRHGASGGRHLTIHGALDWVEWIDRQMAAQTGRAA